jgi:hypothetical protein
MTRFDPAGPFVSLCAREEAKRVFRQIENCTLMTAEVRKTCNEVKEKIAAPAT